MLDDFYFRDSRLLLVPIEHLSPSGVSADFSRILAERRRNGAALAAAIDEAFPLYWQRSSALAGRSRQWPPPRLRNIAVIDADTAIPPYVQLLNTSTWTLFDCDFDARRSNAEFLAYLLAHGDRMASTGEVTMAALHNAAYWFDRSDDEISRFRAAASSSRRPDAAAYAALAEAIDWLRELEHETLRPPRSAGGRLPIAATGYLVPRRLREKPDRLVATWTAAARQAVQRYHSRHCQTDRQSLQQLLDWLRADAPDMLITGRDNRVLWDPAAAERIGAVRNELRRAGGETVRSIHRDLEIVDHHSRCFRERAVLAELPAAGEEIAQDGYTYLYAGRRALAYNLHEPLLQRLAAPALPFARSMLGARAYHEWCHLAVDAGWVGTSVPDEQVLARIEALRELFDEAVANAPPAVRRLGDDDLHVLRASYPADRTVDWGGAAISVGGATSGAALLRMLLPRVADYKANLAAARLQSDDEREAYVRQNVRTLRGEYQRPQLWRALARYLYELQYLRFSSVPDRREYFLRSTWFDADFIDSGILTTELFESLDHAFAQLLDVFTVDESKLRLPAN
jgi:hypothetical protein